MKKIIFTIALLILAGCKPEQVPISQVISGLKASPSAPLADGTTLVYVSCQMNTLTDANKQSIIFIASSGIFQPAGDTTVTVAATFVSQQLVATAVLKMPFTAGKIYITAKPAAVSQYANYALKDTINVAASFPSTLALTPSAISIKADYGSEITLTALLKNSAGNPVSSGTPVTFSDVYPTGLPVGGTYRATRDTTDVTSTAVTYYSIGTGIPSGTTFYVQCAYTAPGGAVLTGKSLITVQ